jgi:hypothetical protein
VENIYCKKCGAVLGVATAMIRAQRKPITPEDTGMRWRLVVIGIPMMVGLLTALNGVGALLGIHSVFVQAFKGGNIARYVLVIAVSNVVSFFISGAILARISGRGATRESVIAAAVSMVLLGSVLTIDLLITALAALIPSTAAAWAGARIGIRKRDTHP